jgi:rare lipoprotein A
MLKTVKSQGPLLLLFLLLLNACTNQHGRYQQSSDSTPTRLPNVAELRDAIPRQEAHSRGGNRDYQVRGKHYQVLKSAENFEQKGTASWYGKKFHGHLTSNGEVYDMYAMSAAHKNLPLPTYAQITNLSNNKSVIVRINDRGPFHQSRVIDLSYSAAYKLDMLKTGTAPVSIKAINHFDTSATPAPDQRLSPVPIPEPEVVTAPGHYIQVFATKDPAVAKSTASALARLYQQNVIWPEADGIYRVQIGPIEQRAQTVSILSTLKKTGYPTAYRKQVHPTDTE